MINQRCFLSYTEHPPPLNLNTHILFLNYSFGAYIHKIIRLANILALQHFLDQEPTLLNLFLNPFLATGCRQKNISQCNTRNVYNLQTSQTDISCWTISSHHEFPVTTVKGSQLGAFSPYVSVPLPDFKLRYLKNLKSFSIRVKDLSLQFCE